jgi:spore maturation protein CgeB
VHVGLIGPGGPDLFGDNIGDALLHMGHRVTALGSTRTHGPGRVVPRVSELAQTALPNVERRLHRRLVRAALDHECDAVLTVEATLAPDAVAALRHHRVPVALWYPDCVANLGRMRLLTAPYTALFVKDPLLARRLKAMLELPVWYLPEACNPRWHRPIGDAGSERAIAVVGNIYPSRLLVLRRLHQAGIPMMIYGGPAPRWLRDMVPAGLHAGRAVFREAKSRVFRAAAGVLNNLHPGEVEGVNCRLFEATAAGAAVLCERRPALADLFDTDREVVPFSDVGELIDRSRHLLADAHLTAEIGDAASKRAHAEHTYEHRLPTILERLA